jgi:hypothetical protein
MRIRTLWVAGFILGWAAAAFAQGGLSAARTERAQVPGWQAAYARGDFPTAGALLQALVFEHPQQLPQGSARYPDAEAIQTLARMYADGQGVPQDLLTACGLSNLASGAAVYQHGDRDARTAAIRRQVEAHCVPLTPAERRDAMQANRCFQLGPSPRVLVESPARRVELGRSGLTIVEHGRTREYALLPLVRCAQQVPEVRYARVAPPKGSKLRAREFVEIYAWHSSVRDGQRLRTLEWSAVELTGPSVALRARTVLERGEGSAWPARGVPDIFSSPVKFAMHTSGDVRWQMAGRSGLHGVIGRPAALAASGKVQKGFR